MLSGDAIQLDVREIGQGVATHKFINPGDLTPDEMYCAVVAFFASIDPRRVGTAYILFK